MPGVAVVTGTGRGYGRAIAVRLAGRGYTVLATDVDGAAAADTAEQVGGFSLELDVRDPDAHRAAARAAAERGPLEVWVNNSGVMRAGAAWEHSDEEVRLSWRAGRAARRPPPAQAGRPAPNSFHCTENGGAR